jgi:vacuolar protein sorting-associated protein 11
MLWKRFQFFDKELVKSEGSNEAHELFKKLDITACAGGRGSLIFGDAEGFLNVVDRDFKAEAWQAYEHRVTHLKQLQRRNIVVSIGNDEELLATIKLWHLDKRDKQGTPLLLQSVRLQRDKPVPVTCFAVTEDLSQIAIGLADGAVVLVTGDIVRARAPKQQVLRRASAGNDYVTGLGFRERPNRAILFVTTSASVLSYVTRSSGSSRADSDEDASAVAVSSSSSGAIKQRVLDPASGAELHCVTMSQDNGYVVVGRQEAVFFFDAGGRGPCFAFEGLKQRLMWFRSYLVVVTSKDPNARLNTLNIYDLKNKLIAYTGSFERIADMCQEWGSVFLLTNDGKLYQLEEKDTQTKLETLFRRNLYTVAINLALSQKMDYSSVIDIFRKYGDHLYDKGDFDGAMTQYMRTIGRLEPSYVIRKFLDAQRIHNLTAYLQCLHEKNLAQPDHTTLLLNCHATKLKDDSKLNSFIVDDQLHFEVETAIKVCRQAGYQKHALFLARKHREHNWYLKILLEDLGDYENALRYVNTLPFPHAERTLKEYGKSLVTNMPEETTDLLMRLCTSYTPKQVANLQLSLDNAHRVVFAADHVQAKGSSSASSSAPSASSSSASSSSALDDLKQRGRELMHSALPAQVEQLVFDSDSDSDEPAVAASSSSSSSSSSADDQRRALLGLSSSSSSSPKLSPKVPAKSRVAAPAKAAGKSVASEFIHIYVAQTPWLIKFLEFIVEKNADTSSLVYNTLLELYLRTAEVDATHAADASAKALKLLHTSKAEFNDDHTLVLCQMHNFREGILLLYERMKLYQEIVQHYQEHDEFDNVVAACKRYGDKSPNLWVSALSYFASKKGADANAVKQHIAQVLGYIDRGDLLPPLLVIEILAQNSAVTLESIREYITRRLQQENQLIADDQRQIEQYSTHTEKMRAEITQLRTGAKIFQLSKCTACCSPLDLPAVHFLCMHSFHQRCVGDADMGDELECPLCAPENKKILDIKRSLEDASDQHDQFFNQLERSHDGFSTIAQYFGRCMFNKPAGAVAGGTQQAVAAAAAASAAAAVAAPSAMTSAPQTYLPKMTRLEF